MNKKNKCVYGEEWRLLFFKGYLMLIAENEYWARKIRKRKKIRPIKSQEELRKEIVHE